MLLRISDHRINWTWWCWLFSWGTGRHWTYCWTRSTKLKSTLDHRLRCKKYQIEPSTQFEQRKRTCQKPARKECTLYYMITTSEKSSGGNKSESIESSKVSQGITNKAWKYCRGCSITVPNSSPSFTLTWPVLSERATMLWLSTCWSKPCKIRAPTSWTFLRNITACWLEILLF